METLQNLPPAVTLVLVLLLVVWLVLLLLVPFMIESIRGWTRKTYLELEEMNKRLEKLTGMLERDAAPQRPDALRPIDPRVDAPPPPGPRAPRVRQEPTNSG
jgi:predicted PurR-regulated permease PerM